MRQLTASQKIAILETRVAQLEKQAFLESIKEGISEFFGRFKSLISTLKKLISPIKSKVSKQSITSFASSEEYKQAMEDIKSNAGNNLKNQLQYLVKEHKAAKRTKMALQGWERSLSSLVSKGTFYASGVFVAYMAVMCLVVAASTYLRKKGYLTTQAFAYFGGFSAFVIANALAAYLFGGSGF